MGKLDPIRRLREARGLTQAELASRAAISRQALGAIEAGRVDPSLSVMLALAGALGATLDALVEGSAEPATVRADGDAAVGQRVVLTARDDVRVAHGLGATDGDQPADGRVIGHAGADDAGYGQRDGGTGRLVVELFAPAAARHVVVPGCAPILGSLTQRLNATRREARWAWVHRTSAQALAGLGRGATTVAGVHGEVRRGERRERVPIVAWESGLIVRPGNPKRLTAIADLARPHLKIAVREPGAETRRLAERLLAAAGIAPHAVLAEALLAPSHADVARAVAFGVAHVGFGSRAAALAAGLDFVSLAHERFDLVVADGAAEDPPIAALLELARGAAFRREAASLGYDLPAVGDR